MGGGRGSAFAWRAGRWHCHRWAFGFDGRWRLAWAEGPGWQAVALALAPAVDDVPLQQQRSKGHYDKAV